ncbi:replication protein A 70 kDa DNA-binding subunit E-like [Cryptomeria japonica]|uniref:replication protein A 70 kDa DNA-binding subunit E-like n=1 Tax=Cryptomeria japonica TaxID=3369 RepID=UPI0027DA5FE9|nr:replication protein A 70 kDa DNA-binding subunit E-like [Cryptomeria japonica]
MCTNADYFVGLVSEVVGVNGFTLPGLLLLLCYLSVCGRDYFQPTLSLFTLTEYFPMAISMHVLCFSNNVVFNDFVPKAKNQEYVPTPFAIQSVNAGDDLPSALLQVLSFQKMQNNKDDSDRHKLVLSDGTYMQLFATELPSPQTTTSENISPIKTLNPYQNKWTIKGRVTHKRPIKAYSTATKNGHVFSFDIVDCDGSEIRITCFDEIAKLHSNRVDIGSHYIISKGSVKEANARYNKLNNHLEITLSDTSILKHCTNEEQPDQQSPPFTPITELFHLTNNTLVDIIGLVLYVGDIIPIHRKDGSQTQKRLVKINDLFGSKIDINLWGPMVEQKGLELKNMLTNDSLLILALLNARVGYFNGKLINITVETTLHINPNFLEVELLTLRGKDPLLAVPFVAHTIHIDGRYTRMTISSIREQMSIKLETIQTTLLVVLCFVNINDQNFYYATCPLIVNGRPCKKKCTQHADGSWFCYRCQMSMQDCNYSYLLPLKLQDATGTLWATAFDEGAIHLLHKTEKQLYALQNDATITETPSLVIKRLLSCYYSFTVLVSTKTYNS